jgi:HEAT repeat protein
MVRRLSLLVLSALILVNLAFGHGGDYRRPDGSRISPFGAPTSRPPGKHPPRTDRTLEWSMWWDHNADVHLHARAKTSTRMQNRSAVMLVLRHGLRDSFFDARAASVIALGKVVDCSEALLLAEAVSSMRPLLADSEKEVRESACLGLGLLGDQSQISDLVLLLKDDPKARVLTGASSRPVLVRQRGFAAVAVGLIGMRDDVGDAVAAELLGVLKNDPDREVRVMAALALGVMRNRSAVTELRKIAADAEADAIVRAHAIGALAKLGDREIAGWLAKDGLIDKSSDVQRSSAIALGLLTAGAAEPTIQALMSHARSSADRAVRNFSLIALGRIGAPSAIGFLLEMVAKGQPHDRTFSALALGVAGAKDAARRQEMGEALLSAWKATKSEYDRAAFAIGLGLLGEERAIPLLTAALEKATTADLKGHAATALGLLGAKEAAPLVRDLARDATDPEARGRARRALGLLGDPEVDVRLLEAIRAGGHELEALGGAALGLGIGGGKEAVASLSDVLSKPDHHRDTARAFAAVALGCLGDKDEVPLLVSLRAHCNFLATTDALRELMRVY